MTTTRSVSHGSGVYSAQHACLILTKDTKVLGGGGGTDTQADGWMDGWKGRWMNGRTDGATQALTRENDTTQ